MTATESLCPVCLARLPARREAVGEDGWLVRTCPEHGEFRTRFWHGPPGPAGWDQPKIAPPGTAAVGSAPGEGCPYVCGLCPEHSQRTCTVVFEVTGRCNLGCPVCFADAGTGFDADPTLAALETRLLRARRAAGPANIQISGGEPTLRADLPDIVALAKAAGFPFVQLNTNGLALAANPALAGRLAAAGLDSVFLQCDGVTDAAHVALRGRGLVREKRAAMAACAAAGLGVVLVATLVPGVNDGEVGDLVRLAASLAPGVRGVHFQPAAHFGRYPGNGGSAPRLTLPDVMAALETQTGGMVRAEDLHPPCCEHSLCSFSASYRVLPDGRLALAGSGGCCDKTAIPAEEGARQSMAFVARQWGAARPVPAPEAIKDDFDRFLAAAAATPTVSLSAMAFMDAWTLDLERARGCCIHVAAPDDRLIPFCLYNLTAADGTALYRRKSCA
ncbi:radical SAM (seleno)protein TrsS [Desulfovibrio sp. TomC]|uniref:radical SAM (seleno)protein TrsS n=1 Tax=Desulfovibrio sp. TomC TaxID=1562888 RepID=UPI0005746D2A|nr:radical SAM (seleno)protein TrsS [Desulfovibrio sp. TomC]KHK02631.1 Molybdenum cofactor biosynthesis protein MoaA [Desulfovibrio sp. TomC]